MTEETVTIRPFRMPDTEQLVAIWWDASMLAHAFLGEDTLCEQKMLVRDIYLPQAETWVAVLKGQPVGFIGLIGNFIGGLFVTPDQHGRGIARCLVEHALRLKETLELDVYADNPIAPGFYRHLGFKEISRRPTDDDGRSFPLIRMRLSA